MIFVLIFTFVNAESNSSKHYLLDKGVFYKNKGQFDSALYFTKLSILESRNNSDSISLARTYNNLGIIFKCIAQHDSALFYYYKSASIFEKTNELYLALTYKNIADVLILTNDLDKALNYLTDSKSIYESKKDSSGLFKIFNSFANLYYKQKNFKLALSNYRTSLTYIDNNPLNLGIVYNNLATTFQNLNNLDSAIFYNKKALGISKSIDDKIGIISSYNNLAQIYENKNNYPDAKSYYLKALTIAEQINALEEQRFILDNLSSLSKKFNDYPSALLYLDKYLVVNDSIFSEEKAKSLAEIRESYETLQKENKILELGKQNLETKAKLKTILFSFVIFVLLAIISVLFYVRKRRIEKIKQDTEIKEALYAAIIESQENERERISLDLHDRLGGYLSISRMLLTSAENKFAQVNMSEIYNRLDKLLITSANVSRSISHELYDQNLKLTGFNQSIKQYLDDLKTTSNEIEFQLKTNVIKNDFNINFIINVYRVLQELITNTIKYSEATKATIFIEETDSEIWLKYTDNGIGINENKISNGIGLKGIKARVKKLNGNIDFKNIINNGISVTARFPFQN